jgi:hypothetical protein
LPSARDELFRQPNQQRLSYSPQNVDKIEKRRVSRMEMIKLEKKEKTKKERLIR